MTIKALFTNVLAILVAAVAAEGIVRVAIHPALDYTSGFSPGPYCLNQALGVSFKCPDRAGMMHVAGTKIYLPYRTNEDGFRGPFRSPSRGGNVSTIVALGGQSQAFGYGLLDADTIGANIARSCGTAEVDVFSLPGVTDAQSWKLYNLSARAKSPPDQIVLLVQSRSKKDWRREESAESKLLDESYAVLYGWLYEIPRWLMKFSDSALVVRSVKSIREIGSYLELVKKPAQEFGPDLYTADFIGTMAQEARRLNVKFSVAFMPGARERGLYVDTGAIERALPDVRFIDVDAKSAALHLYPEQLLPDRHYNAPLAKFIGAEIAQSICPMSQNATPKNSGVEP
jgi:hypothetical protein